MLTYIIQVVLFQVLFLAVYDFVLSKETFFAKNRWYLIGTVILSFLLPLIKISTVKTVVENEYLVLLPEVILSPEKVIEQQEWYQSIDYLDVIFWIGLLVFTVLFLLKISQLVSLVYKNNVEQYYDYKLVKLSNTTKAFSFFNFIFLGDKITEEKKKEIIAHELVHIKQKHSWDLLFFEILKIVMWFNPVLRVYQKRITLVHEFLSDEVVSKKQNQKNYINNLLSEVFQVEQMSFVNQFYKNSLIKKRIIMIRKSRSKQSKQLKYLVLIPVLISMLFYTACSEEENILVNSRLERQKLFKNLDEVPVTLDRETYMDVYMGGDLPNTKEYTINDLTNEEKEEFLKAKSKLNAKDVMEIKIYEGLKNRKMLVFHYLRNRAVTGKSLANGTVSLNDLDVFPTFLGCSEGNKECFNKSMIAFVQKNFDPTLANSLGLKKGKQRIFVKFKITKTGEITEIKARAPHRKLVTQVEELIKKLPKIKPGKKNNEAVNVGYVLPITFNIQ